MAFKEYENLICQTVNQVRKGRMAVAVANCVGFLTGHFLKAREVGEVGKNSQKSDGDWGVRTKLKERLDKILLDLPLPCAHKPIPSAIVQQDAESAEEVEKIIQARQECETCREKPLMALDQTAKNSQEWAMTEAAGNDRATSIRDGNLELGLNYDRGSKNGNVV